MTDHVIRTLLLFLQKHCYWQNNGLQIRKKRKREEEWKKERKQNSNILQNIFTKFKDDRKKNSKQKTPSILSICCKILIKIWEIGEVLPCTLSPLLIMNLALSGTTSHGEVNYRYNLSTLWEMIVFRKKVDKKKLHVT